MFNSIFLVFLIFQQQQPFYDPFPRRPGWAGTWKRLAHCGCLNVTCWLLELSCSHLTVWPTASWLAPAAQMKVLYSKLVREPNVPHQDFTPDTLPAATLPIYLCLGTSSQCAGLHTLGLDFFPIFQRETYQQRQASTTEASITTYVFVTKFWHSVQVRPGHLKVYMESRKISKFFTSQKSSPMPNQQHHSTDGRVQQRLPNQTSKQ